VAPEQVWVLSAHGLSPPCRFDSPTIAKHPRLLRMIRVWEGRLWPALQGPERGARPQKGPAPESDTGQKTARFGRGSSFRARISGTRLCVLANSLNSQVAGLVSQPTPAKPYARPQRLRGRAAPTVRVKPRWLQADAR
jgi:hypothetical protein